MPFGNNNTVTQSVDSPHHEFDSDAPMHHRKTLSSPQTKTSSLVSIPLTDKDRKSLPTSLRVDTVIHQDVLEEVLRRASIHTAPIHPHSAISDDILDPGAEQRLIQEVSRSRSSSVAGPRSRSSSIAPRSRASSITRSPNPSVGPRSRASSVARSRDHSLVRSRDNSLVRSRDNSVSPDLSRRNRSVSSASDASNATDLSYLSEGQRVDWDELERAQVRNDNGDDETTLLLARLEQENNAIATDPKSGLKTRGKSQARPPSIVELQKLVEEKGARSVRFSLMPAAAPMTELDFWAALVRDYPQTVQRLPTITANKIRSGIPAPLRGVVWISMAGARDRSLEATFDKLVNESSPYEQLIGVDVGRSFPGHELFKDPEGDGQRMLGRVLKCYSLYDEKIGYCQGLGFLVGPLLMNMGDREAFCVLVRLMRDYDLRACFLPDLSGLHLRIFQFKALLKQHVPKVAAHLEALQVEGEYLSQWFLSFFAVTCPLPLLFRIYDVVFAEGASETIMRVALAIVQRNERKILAYDEFDDVMQLLLSRQLWDVYGLSPTSADQFVQNFVSFTHLVTRESLTSLEADFRARQAQNNRRPSVGAPNTTNAARGFLGRLWAGGSKQQQAAAPVSASVSPQQMQQQTQQNQPPRQQSLSPEDAVRPKTLLRQTSKSSMCTVSSNEGSPIEMNASANTSSTALTDFSFSGHASSEVSLHKSGKHTDSVPRSIRHTSTKERELEAQIEGLLTMISELQRNHATLENQHQKAVEDWNDDTVAIRTFLDQVKADITTSMSSSVGKKSFARRASEANPPPPNMSPALSQTSVRLLHSLDRRYATRSSRRSADLVTKEELRSTLAATREQLQIETHKTKEFEHQMEMKEHEASILRSELQIARNRIKDAHFDKQRLEKSILELKHSKKQLTTPRPTSRYNTIEEEPEVEVREALENPTPNQSGLRELRLGRNTLTRSGDSSSSNASTTAIFAKRTSSLGPTPNPISNPPSSVSSPTQESAPSLVSAISSVLSSPISTVPPSLASSRNPTALNIRSLRSAASSMTSLGSSAFGDHQVNDKILLDLASAKTAEAVARQELDELRQRFDSMRKMMTSVAGSFPPSPSPPAAGHENKNPFGRTMSGSEQSFLSTPASTPGGLGHMHNASTSSVGSGFGSFWWGRK